MSGGEPAPARPALPAVVALRYDRNDPSGAPPWVVAAGRGEVAARILAAAGRHGIPVRQDAELVQLLAACGPGEEIPVELFEAVAQLLTWLYRAEAGLEGASADPADGA